MQYEIWDTHSGNLVERFDSEGEAIGATRELLELNGRAFVYALALGAVRDPDVVHRLEPDLPPILEGEDLLQRVAALGPLPI
jgi:hypothetical protein